MSLRALRREAACRALVLASVWISALASSTAQSDGVPLVTADDYARAERFLTWNKDRYVVNGDIQHHWLGEQDRFWYLRSNAAGDKEFVVVDAATGLSSAAFDHVKLAALLSKTSGTGVDPARLPFSSFRYGTGGTSVQFEWADQSWMCHLQLDRCEASSAEAAAHEVLSPDGKWAAFLRDYDLWIRPTSGAEAFPLTTDGVEHYGYAVSPGYSTHAVSDLRSGAVPSPQLWWSPDSRFVLSHRLDERNVEDLYLVQSTPEDGSARPRLYAYRYALPGDEHVPTLELVVFDVGARRQVKLSSGVLFCSVQSLIAQGEAWWAANSKAIYYVSRDRHSRSVALNRAEPESGRVRAILRQTSDSVVHTNANSAFDSPLVRVLSNGDVIWYSQRDGWGHLYYYESNGTLRNRITRGNWAVRDIVRIEEAAQSVYFMASGMDDARDPYEQSMYVIRFDGSGMRLLTPEQGDHKWQHDVPLDATLWPDRERARFSFSGRYFVDSYSRPDLPSTLVVRDAGGRLIRQVQQADITKLREGGYRPIEPFRVLAADGKTAIYGNLFRPSTFDPTKRYPIIDASYPGPQMIRTGKSFTAAAFGQFEAQSLAELGFIVVTIDGRGTPNRSKAFLEHSYGRLDKASDLEDHIAGIRQLAQRYHYMDLGRVGIDGVSAGGAMAAHAILSYPHFYKVAVAAEGSHDSRGYLAPWDEVYAGPAVERGDSTPATTSRVANLQGKLLLMHGEMDDNVSPTLTLKLVDALIKANKDFDLLILPNANHAAFLMSPYFIRRKWDYFVRNLLRAEPPVGYSIKQPQ